MSRVPVLTIDGPSGSGKGTVSRAAARALGWGLLDSGALYRLVALAGKRAGIDLAAGTELGEIALQFDIRFGSNAAGEERVWLNGEDVTRAIRTEQAGNDASKVASLPPVRAASRIGNDALPSRRAWWRTGAIWDYGIPGGRRQDLPHRERSGKGGETV